MTTSQTLPAPDPVLVPAPGVGRRVTALVAAGALAVGLLGGVGVGRLTAPAAASTGAGASAFPQGGPGAQGGAGGTGGTGLPGQMGAPGGSTAQGGTGQQGQAPGTTGGTTSST